MMTSTPVTICFVNVIPENKNKKFNQKSFKQKNCDDLCAAWSTVTRFGSIECRYFALRYNNIFMSLALLLWWTRTED